MRHSARLSPYDCCLGSAKDPAEAEGPVSCLVCAPASILSQVQHSHFHIAPSLVFQQTDLKNMVVVKAVVQMVALSMMSQLY